MEYKLYSKRHGWIILREIFLLFGTISIVPLSYIYYDIDKEKVIEVFYFSLIFSLVFYLPLLILHLNYYFKSTNNVIYIDYDSKKIEINDSVSIKSYHFNEIKMILIIKSYNNRLPWSDYGYMKIGLKDGNVIVITTLMTDLEKVNFENTNSFKELYPYCS